jgi:hypothetical protein
VNVTSERRRRRGPHSLGGGGRTLPLHALPLSRADSGARERRAARRVRSGVRARRRALTLVPRGRAVHAHREVVVRLAALERARVIVGGHVPVATHLVVDVLAVLARIRAGARPEAELGVGDERRPLVVLQVSTKRVAKDEAADYTAIVSSCLFESVKLHDTNLGCRCRRGRAGRARLPHRRAGR